MGVRKAAVKRERHLFIKFLDGEGRGPSYPKCVYALPKGGKPGKWMPKITNPVMCARGYHAATPQSAYSWSDVTAYVCEYASKPVVRGRDTSWGGGADDTKACGDQMRLLCQIGKPVKVKSGVVLCKELLAAVVGNHSHHDATLVQLLEVCIKYKEVGLVAGHTRKAVAAYLKGDYYKFYDAANALLMHTCVADVGDEDKEVDLPVAAYTKAIKAAEKKYPWVAPRAVKVKPKRKR